MKDNNMLGATVMGKTMIDRIRDSGGRAIIGNRETPILKMVEIDGKLVHIKNDSVHDFFFADKIDPRRKNISLPPNIQQPILHRGVDSEIVARTFMTASLLFDKQYIVDGVEINIVLKLSLGIAQDLIELENAINKYQDDYKLAIDAAAKNISFTLPHIENLESQCKTMIQKAYHVSIKLRKMAKTIFHGERIDNFADLANVILSKYGNENIWGQFLAECAPMMQKIIDVRNGLDHDVGSVTIQNFNLEESGKIVPPTIKSKHGTRLAKTDLSNFLRTLQINLIEVAEAVIAGLASGLVKPGYPNYMVADIPDGLRKYEFVRYAMWCETPVNNEGFYHQK